MSILSLTHQNKSPTQGRAQKTNQSKEREVTEMKKLLILLLVLLVMLAVAAPALAYHGGGSEGNSTGDGVPPGWADAGGDDGPPGWSHVNPGAGGTHPGQ